MVHRGLSCAGARQQPERNWSERDIVRLAKANHMYINRMSTIRPSQEFLAGIGRDVLTMLDHTPMTDSLAGVTPVVYVRFNAS